MEIDRRSFIAGLGGTAAVTLMDSEAKADALEHYMEDRLDAEVAALQQNGAAPARFPTAAEIEAQIETRQLSVEASAICFRSTGRTRPSRSSSRCRRSPRCWTSSGCDFAPANHVLQSATRAMKTGMTEEVILACLLHDTVQAIIKTDHGWWVAHLFEPYIPGEVDVRDPVPPGAALL